jgi:hypothetical protein
MRFYVWKINYKKVKNPILLKFSFNVHGGLKYWIGKKLSLVICEDNLIMIMDHVMKKIK